MSEVEQTDNESIGSLIVKERAGFDDEIDATFYIQEIKPTKEALSYLSNPDNALRVFVDLQQISGVTFDVEIINKELAAEILCNLVQGAIDTLEILESDGRFLENLPKILLVYLDKSNSKLMPQHVTFPDIQYVNKKEVSFVELFEYLPYISFNFQILINTLKLVSTHGREVVDKKNTFVGDFADRFYLAMVEEIDHVDFLLNNPEYMSTEKDHFSELSQVKYDSLQIELRAIGRQIQMIKYKYEKQGLSVPKATLANLERRYREAGELLKNNT